MPPPHFRLVPPQFVCSGDSTGLKPVFAQTMGRDHNWLLSVYGYSGTTMRAKEALAFLAESLKKFNPKMQAVKHVFKLT